MHMLASTQATMALDPCPTTSSRLGCQPRLTTFLSTITCRRSPTTQPNHAYPAQYPPAWASDGSAFPPPNSRHQRRVSPLDYTVQSAKATAWEDAVGVDMTRCVRPIQRVTCTRITAAFIDALQCTLPNAYIITIVDSAAQQELCHALDRQLCELTIVLDPPLDCPQADVHLQPLHPAGPAPHPAN